MPPPRASSLKRSREEEEEDKPTQKLSGRSKVDRVMDKTRFLSVLAFPKETFNVTKARGHPSSSFP